MRASSVTWVRPSGHEGMRHKLRGQTYKTMRASFLSYRGKPSQSGGWESEQQLRPLSSLSTKTFRCTPPPIAALGSTYHGCRTCVPRPPYNIYHGRHTRVRRPPYPHPGPGKARAICRRSVCLQACLHHESAVRAPGCKTFGTTLRVFSKNVVTLQAQEFDNHKLFIQ